jgi:hypothetical protein
MRLRKAVIATAVLIAFGILVAAHQRATAEHDRNALVLAEIASATEAPAVAGSSEAAPQGPASSSTAPAVAASTEAAPQGPASSSGSALAATPPVAGAPAGTPVPTLSVRVPTTTGVVQVTPAPSAFSPVPAPPQPSYARGHWFYTVPAPGDDPEANELTSQDQQLEQEVQSLARQLADSEDDKQRADLKEKLGAALEKQFDVQQKLREREISRIEARVEKLRGLVRKRTESRRKIIDGRFEQLLNDAEGLGWNSAKAPSLQVVPYGVPATVPPRPDAAKF